MANVIGWGVIFLCALIAAVYAFVFFVGRFLARTSDDTDQREDGQK